MSLCHECANCWGTTKDGKARCYVFSMKESKRDIKLAEMALVDQRDECEFFEEADDWSSLDEVHRIGPDGYPTMP